MSLPTQTPTAKAASIIKRFQTTIDNLDANLTLNTSTNKKEPSKKPSSSHSPSPRSAPPLNRIKHNLSTGSNNSPRVTSLQLDPKLIPGINQTTSISDTAPENIPNSLPSQAGLMIENDKDDASIIPQPILCNDTSPINQPEDPSQEFPKSDLPSSDLSKQTSSVDQMPHVSTAPQPLKVLEPSSDPSQSSLTTNPTVHHPNVTKLLATKSPLASSTRAKVKPTVLPGNTRKPITKTTPSTVSTSAPRVSLSNKNSNLNSSTAASRAKAQHSLAASTNSRPKVSSNKINPISSSQNSVGSLTLPRNTSNLRMTSKMSDSLSPAKLNASQTQTSTLRKSRFSLKPDLDPPKMSPNKTTQPATNQPNRNSTIVKTKSSPLTLVDVKTNSVNPAPLKINRRISITNSSKPLKAESKSHSSVTNTAIMPSKKPSQKPLPLHHASVEALAVDAKKPNNSRLASKPPEKQSTASSSRRPLTTVNKTLDVKFPGPTNRSNLAKTPTVIKKVTKLSTKPIPGTLPAQPEKKSITKNTKVPAPVDEGLAPKTRNQDGAARAESEISSHSALEVTEEQENQTENLVKQNQSDEQTTTVQSDGHVVVLRSKEQDHSQNPDQGVPTASIPKDMATQAANEDVTEAKSVGEPAELPNHSQLVGQSRVATPETQEKVNPFPDENRVEPEDVSKEPKVNDLVNESNFGQPGPHHPYPSSTKEELPFTNTDEDVTQAESEPRPHAHLEHQDLITPSTEQESLVSTKKELTSVDLNEFDNQTQPVVESAPIPFSQLEHQDIDVNIVGEQDNQTNHPVSANKFDEQIIPVDSELVSLRGEPKLEFSSQLADQDQTNEDKNDDQPGGESGTFIDPEVKNEESGLAFTGAMNTSQFDNRIQVGGENLGSKSEETDFDEESIRETHSKSRDEDPTSISEQQIDNSLSTAKNDIKTETSRINAEQVSESSDRGTSTVLSPIGASQYTGHARCESSVKQENDVRMSDTEDREETKVADSSETLDNNFKNVGLDDNDCIFPRYDDGNPLPVEKLGYEGQKEIQPEEGKTSLKSAGSTSVYELMPKSHSLLDLQEGALKSEESEPLANDFHFGDQAEKEIISESLSESQPPQLVDGDRVSQPAETQLETYQPNAEPHFSVESMGESRSDLDPHYIGIDQALGQDHATSESEDSQFVYSKDQAEPEQKITLVKHQLDCTPPVQLTPESEASQFVYNGNQEDQVIPEVNPDLNHPSFMEAASHTREIPELSMDLSLNDQTNDKPLSKHDEGFSRPPSEIKFQLESDDESQSIVFQTLASSPDNKANEANPFNDQAQENKTIDSPNPETDDLINEFKSKSHSQHEKQDEHLILEAEEIDLNRSRNVGVEKNRLESDLDDQLVDVPTHNI